MANIERELQEKNKVYNRKSKYIIKRNIIIGVIILCYAFLFSSAYIVPKPLSSASSTTKRGSDVVFAENRIATLVSADYDRNKEIMEIVINFQNLNYDNIDNYYYAINLLGASTKGTKIKELYNEDLFTVVRISNVPKNYREMEFMFAPKVTELSKITNSLTGEFVLNKRNVSEVNINLDKSKKDYLKDRLDNVIANYENILERQKAKAEELSATILALESENKSIMENAAFMTEKEIEQKQRVILGNQEDIVKTQADLDKVNQKIAYTEKMIQESKLKADAL